MMDTIRTTRWIVGAAVVLVSAGCGGGGGPTRPGPTGSIEGIIRDPDGAPASRAFVSVFYDLERVQRGPDVLPDRASAVPPRGRLIGNTPNPFYPATSVRYELFETARVSLHVADRAGRPVRTLVRDLMQSPGEHAVSWDGRSGAGRWMPVGLYTVRLGVGDGDEAQTDELSIFMHPCGEGPDLSTIPVSYLVRTDRDGNLSIPVRDLPLDATTPLVTEEGQTVGTLRVTRRLQVCAVTRDEASAGCAVIQIADPDEDVALDIVLR